MISFILLAAAFISSVHAQAKCEYLKNIKPLPDPLVGFQGGTATFPCDMGGTVPYGKVPKGCAKFEVIVARGTSEPGDLGMVVGDPVVARVKRDMPGEDARGYPVQYPAGFIGSGTGVSDVQKRLAAQIKECPDAKFALLGYSQGGMVVTSAIGSLSQATKDKIFAVVLYGAGDGSAVTGTLRNRTLANCAPGDFACPSSGVGEGHVSYNNVGSDWHDRSSKYIVSAFHGQFLGKKLMRTPKGAI